MGPLLWNVMYDAVLDTKLPEGVEEIGFADDIGIVATAKSMSELETKANEALRRISNVLKDNNLELAAHKSEAVILAGRRRYEPPHITVGDQEIPSS